MSTDHWVPSNDISKLVLKHLSYFLLLSLHTGVRVVRIVRRVRALSVWRESAPSAVRTARSALALQPQPSPALHPANTPTGTINTNDSSKSSYRCFACFNFGYCTALTEFSQTSSVIDCLFAVCRTMNRRAVVTQWTALPLRMPLATATVPSQGDASSLAAIRTVSPVLRVLPRKPSPASQQFALWWYLQ